MDCGTDFSVYHLCSTLLFIAGILVFIAWQPLGQPNPSVANLALAIVLEIVWIVQAFFSFWQDTRCLRFDFLCFGRIELTRSTEGERLSLLPLRLFMFV